MDYTTLYDELKLSHIKLQEKVNKLTTREARIDYLNDLYTYRILIQTVNKLISAVVDKAIQKTLSQIE